MRKAREEGFGEGLKRWKEEFARFGIEIDGVVMLPLTQEVEQFLDSEAAG